MGRLRAIASAVGARHVPGTKSVTVQPRSSPGVLESSFLHIHSSDHSEGQIMAPREPPGAARKTLGELAFYVEWPSAMSAMSRARELLPAK